MTTTISDADVALLRKMPLFAGLADDDLGCIKLGEVIEAAPGTVLTREDDGPGYFYVTIEGEVNVWRSYDRQDVLMAVSRPGHFMGEIPILLDSQMLATARVAKPTRLFRLDQEGFWKMLGTCPSVTRVILRTVAERFRNLEGFAFQREKLISLGTMAAGLAHELNNPASAALRAASYLRQATDNTHALLCSLGKTLEQEHWEPLLGASSEALERQGNAPPLDSITRSDRQEALNEFFEQNRIPEGWNLSGTFVESGIDVPWLQALISTLPAESRGDAVRWVEARLSVKLLLKQIETSTGRVSELVKAVKSYTHKDRSPMQETDIHEGIESTLTMLGHKLKGVTLRRAFDRSAPRIMAYPGELNQVWTNLIDNAVDAVEGKGKICVGTFFEDGQIYVEIVDNGVGIPKEIQSHIFEPFFTTKAIGTGTGIGLVISNRIIADRHGGEIEFESKPGETRFKVRLPLRTPMDVKPTV
jgi:signal transduction histidine kinase